MIVTATLDNEGVSWPAELPEEWVADVGDDGDAMTHTFADVSCTTALPVAPEVVMASCAVDGAVVPASVTLASTPGIVYTVAPAEPYDPAVDTEVVVTATLEQGYAWGDVGTAAPVGFARSSSGRSRSLPGAGFVMALPTGWVETSPTTATFTVVLPGAARVPGTDDGHRPGGRRGDQPEQDDARRPPSTRGHRSRAPEQAASAESSRSVCQTRWP